MEKWMNHHILKQKLLKLCFLSIILSFSIGCIPVDEVEEDNSAKILELKLKLLEFEISNDLNPINYRKPNVFIPARDCDR